MTVLPAIIINLMPFKKRDIQNIHCGGQMDTRRSGNSQENRASVSEDREGRQSRPR